MRNVIILLLVFLAFGCTNTKTDLLIEAESFSEKGGWVLDQQFTEQMGSPYLMAHGMGRPVEDAETSVLFPKTGNYHVWVRTKNWKAGNWKAPGRFIIKVGEKVLDAEFGTEEGWNWQYGGEVNISSKNTFIALHDITGFNGRCDALYFSQNKIVPPNEPEKLASWRNRLLKVDETPPDAGNFDVVITGGGIAGCAAAIAAAKEGLNVALIHDRPLLGGNASSEIRVHVEGIPHGAKEILSLIDTKWWPNGSPDAKIDQEKRMKNMVKFTNIHKFLEWRAYGVQMDGNRITAVDAKHTGTGNVLRFKAPVFIDCTGDGWIGFWAGAEMMYGREESDKYNEYWDKYGELWCPKEPDNRIMGSSLLWLTEETDEPVTFPEVPWAMDVAGDHVAVKGEWYWEYSDNNLHQIYDSEYIRDHLLCAIYGSFYNASQLERYRNRKMKWVGYLTGRRESRRITGDYIYTFNDVRELRHFPDEVVCEKRDVDVHHQRKDKDSEQPDFLSRALYYKTDHYYIPFRCLYSRDIGNLMMAGRCYSCSHIGLGGPRVMYTTGQMGVATGYAASLCKKYGTNPRGVYKDYIKELRELVGIDKTIPTR